MFTTPMLTLVENDRVPQVNLKSATDRAQPLGDTQRRLRRTVLEQHAELVAAEACNGVACAQARA